MLIKVIMDDIQAFEWTIFSFKCDGQIFKIVFTLTFDWKAKVVVIGLFDIFVPVQQKAENISYTSYTINCKVFSYIV